MHACIHCTQDHAASGLLTHSPHTRCSLAQPAPLPAPDPPRTRSPDARQVLQLPLGTRSLLQGAITLCLACSSGAASLLRGGRRLLGWCSEPQPTGTGRGAAPASPSCWSRCR